MLRFAAVLALSLAACQGSGGAVSVRWHVVDLSSGDSFDPGSPAVKTPDGACCPTVQFMCPSAAPWVVRSVGLVLRDADSGAPVEEVGSFPCTAREHTTDFTLPLGRFAIALTAAVTDGAGLAVPFSVPPPEVRTIVKGEVVNLSIIEVGVHPLPMPASRTTQ